MRNIYILLLLTFGLGQDYSLQFDGDNDYVDLTNNEGFNFLDKFTIRVNLSVDQFGKCNNCDHSAIVSKKPNTGWGGGFELTTSNTNGINEFGVNYTAPNNNHLIYSNNSITTGTNYELIVTYDGSYIRIYIDGIEKAFAEANGPIGTNNYPVTIGRRADFVEGQREHYYNGFISNIEFWNIALSSEQIESNMFVSDGLIFQYNFNSGTGNILYDSSDNGNHGTIYGATWSSIEGCTDPNATNYDETANVDDGSCEYETVQIGHQVWMTENLKATHYRNGDAIPTGLDNDAWSNATEGAYAIYDDDPINAEIYGNLYNGYIAIDVRGICAENFHIPTDDEWQDLETFLGVPETELNIDAAYRGDSEEVASGGKLKQSGFENWEMPNDGATNVFNFNAIASGSRHYNSATDPSYYDIKKYTRFWSSTYDGSSNNGQGGVYIRALGYDRFGIYRNPDDMNFGFSIRCISDETPNTTILVPENFATIQEALNYAIDGDSVLVSAGTYYENINFNGKNIALIGEDRETTIIDGGQNGSVVVFESGEDSLSVLSDLTITNGNNFNGGGIYCKNSSSPIIDNCIISNNNGIEGGGVKCDGQSNPTIFNTTIKNNEASGNGGGLCSPNSNPVIYNCIFEGNIANQGGGIYVYQGQNISINNSTISDNSAVRGGGIAVQFDSQVDVIESVIENNQAVEQGGGVYVSDNSSINFNNSAIVSNSTSQDCLTNQGSQGAGIMVNSSSIVFSNGEISNNQAADTGGGIFLSDVSTGEFNSSVFYNNRGAVVGGGVYTAGAGIGAIFDSGADFNNCTFSNNYGISGGVGGFFGASSTINIINSILWNNNGEWQNVSGQLLGSVEYSVSYSNIEGVFEGEGNIDADPLFCDADNGDFTVRSDSPVLGAGQGEADMGAYGVGCDPIIGCTDTYALNYTSEVDISDNFTCEYPDNGDYSLSFDGVDDYVDLDNLVPMLTQSLTGTVQIMFKIDLESSSNNQPLFTINQHLDNPFIVRIGNQWCDDETLNSSISFSDDDCGQSNPTVKAYWGDNPLYFYDNNWHILTLSVGDTSHQLFIDGEPINLVYTIGNQNTGNFLWRENTNYFRLGQRWIDSSPDYPDDVQFFEGILDNLVLSVNFLYPDEIESSINSGFNGENDIIAYYKFNAGIGDTLYDHSGNQNHGTIHGATWYMEGCTNPLADNYNPDAAVDDGSCTGSIYEDYSLSFDGVDDYVDVVELSNAIDNSNITLMGWFKSTSNGEPNIYYEGIFGFRNYPNYDGNYFATMSWTGYSEPTIECYGGVPANIPLTPSDDTWYHLALVYEDEIFSTYLDGILIESAFANNDPIVPSIDLLIGNNIENGNHFFQGSIDDISLWSEALNDSLIHSYMIIPPTGSEEGLVGYWNFNQQVMDQTENGNDGTIIGNPEWVLNTYGCSTESDACNYEEGGNFTNEICLYDDCEGVCGGESLADNCGECDGDNSTCDIQSTEVAIYYFSSVTLDGLYPSEIIARNEESGMVVGSGSYGNVGDGITEVMVYGVMGADYVVNTTGLMTPGLTPQFYVDGHKAHYVASDGDILQDIPAFYSYQFYIDLTLDLETDCNGDMGGSAVTTGICGDCWGGTTGYDQDYNDPDGDGVCNCGAPNGDCDNCPNTPNAEQENYDSDSEGDACDADIDDDGALNDADSDDYNIYVCSDSDADTCEDCLNGNYNPSDDGWDYDGDGLCDDGDPDADNDGSDESVDSDDNNEYTCSDDDGDTCDDCSDGSYGLDDDGWDYDQDGACDDGDDDDDNDGALDDADSDDNNEFICSDNDNDTCDDCSDGSYGLDDDGEDNDTDGWCNDGDMWPDCSNEILDEDPNDQCGNCHGDGFADDCVGNNDCNDMDCAGLCGQVNQQDDCSVCDDNYNNDCYDLSIILDGISLISFPALPGSGDYSVENIFSQLCDNPIIGVIGGGSAFVNWGDCQFIGSLSEIAQNEGYWVILSTSPDTLFIDDAIPVSYDADGEVVYEIHYGINLISYPFQTSQYLDDALGDVADSVYALASAGIAALNTDNGWLGFLTAFEGGKGYWLITSYDFNFKFNGAESGLARIAEQPALRPVPEAHRFAQSSRQAFYFIQTAIIRHEPLDEDDIIIAYNGDVVVGARYWNGEYTDVPAMGLDDYSNNEGYCKIGDQISFKVWDSSASKLIDMQADVGTTWNDISVSVINLTEILPETFSLDRAYPNPFNPTTTLNFSLPIDSEVSLSIYNLQGREVVSLINGNIEAGYHSVVWNADSHASGVYFVKMMAGEFTNTQKLMLIK